MMIGGLRISFLALLVCGLMGCASTLTYFGPSQSKLVNGEKSVGAFVGNQYTYKANGHTLQFIKTPMCEEMEQKLRVIQKQQRGFYLALMEVPLFGLGLFDMFNSDAISKASKQVVPLAKFSTKKTVPCGPAVTAANEMFVIEDVIRNIHLSVKTDADGKIDLDRILPGKGLMTLNIYPQGDRGIQMKYQYDTGH